MQLIFQGLPLAALIALPAHNHVAEFMDRGDVRHLLLLSAAMIVCGQITWILSLWAGSKAVAQEDHSTFWNAVNAWLMNWVAVIVIGGSLFFIVPSMAASAERSRLWLVLGGVGLLYFMLIFLIPMRVYVLGFLRAVGLLLLAGLINAVALFALEFGLIFALGLQKDVATLQSSTGKTPAEQQAFVQRLLGREAPDEIDRLLDDALHPMGPRPSLSQREETVRALQQKLGARQKALRPGDLQTQATYQSQLNRYLTLRNEVLAERNGQAPSSVP